MACVSKFGIWPALHHCGSAKSSVMSSSHFKRRSNAEAVAGTLTESQSHDEKFRDCLRRDGNRCAICRSLNVQVWRDSGRPKGVSATYLEAAHIIPFSYAAWNRNSGAPKSAADTWEVLYRCCPEVRRPGLKVDNIKDIPNGITLEQNLHTAFGEFDIAFVATGTPNQYTIKEYPDCPTDVSRLSPRDSIVTLRKADGAEDIPLPDPALLDCHYRLAEILHASGMAEAIDKWLRDLEFLKGTGGQGHLAEDGSSNVETHLKMGLWQSVSA